MMGRVTRRLLWQEVAGRKDKTTNPGCSALAKGPARPFRGRSIARVVAADEKLPRPSGAPGELKSI
jgi:hypothetical protein